MIRYQSLASSLTYCRSGYRIAQLRYYSTLPYMCVLEKIQNAGKDIWWVVFPKIFIFSCLIYDAIILKESQEVYFLKISLPVW